MYRNANPDFHVFLHLTKEGEPDEIIEFNVTLRKDSVEPPKPFENDLEAGTWLWNNGDWFPIVKEDYANREKRD